MKQTKRTLLLLSGGLDSVALLYYLRGTGELVEALYIDYGSNHAAREKEFAVLHCERTGTRLHEQHLPQLQGSRLTGGSGTWVVPGRNAILLAHACNFAESMGFHFVDYACNADDAAGFPDCRVEWVGAFNQQLAMSEMTVRVFTPFITLTKRQLVYFTRRINSAAALDLSWSCYRGQDEPCGNCPACEKRKVALA